MNAVASAFQQVGAPLDTIIAAFAEGSPVGAGSWLFDRSAVAVCVKNPKSIRILQHWML